MKILRTLLATVAASFLVLALFVAFLIYTDSDLLDSWTELALTTVLGRETTLDDIDIRPGSVTHIRLKDLNVTNPSWATSDTFLAAGNVEISFQTWPALIGTFNFELIKSDQINVSAEQDSLGRQTWDFSTSADVAGEIAAPEQRQEFPGINSIQISDAVVHVIDVARKLDKKLTITSGKGELRKGANAVLSLSGAIDEDPLKASFNGGALEVLRSQSIPYPIDLEVIFLKTSMTAKGQIDQPLGDQFFDLALDIKGPTLAELFPIVGVPLPDTPPYSIAGRLKRDTDVWQIKSLDGKVGDSDLSGEIMFEETNPVPLLTADLKSKLLDLDDLAGLIGAQPDIDEAANQDQKASAVKSEESGKLFPDTKLQVERLNAMNMDISLTAAKVSSKAVPIDAIDARFNLKDRKITVDPLQIDIAGGTAQGNVILDAREETPLAQTSISFRALDLKPFFESTDFVQEMGGTFYGNISLNGVGLSLAQIMSNVSGGAWLGIRNGTISGLIVEAAGLDILEALYLVLGDDARIAMPCGRVDLSSNAGLIDIKRAVVDTSDSVLYAVGSANLNKEMLNIQIEAVSKDFSLLDISAPVSVSGSFADPSIAIGGIEGLIVPGKEGAREIDCDALISNAEN